MISKSVKPVVQVVILIWLEGILPATVAGTLGETLICQANFGIILSTWWKYLEIIRAPGGNIWKYLKHLETKVGGFHSKGAGTVNQGAGGRGQGRKSSTNAGGGKSRCTFAILECFCFEIPPQWDACWVLQRARCQCCGGGQSGCVCTALGCGWTLVVLKFKVLDISRGGHKVEIHVDRFWIRVPVLALSGNSVGWQTWTNLWEK